LIWGVRVEDAIDIVEKALALAIDRFDESLVESALKEERRAQIEADMQRIVQDQAEPGQHIFGAVRVVADEWLGTGTWMAFVEILASAIGGDTTESFYAHQAFTNRRPNLENLNNRDGCVTFTLAELTPDIEDALRGAIASAEEMIKRVRGVQAEQVTAHTRFASALLSRYGQSRPQ
jgi:hypothetical protein